MVTVQKLTIAHGGILNVVLEHHVANVVFQVLQVPERVVVVLDVDVPARGAAAGGAGHEQMQAADACARERRSPCVARYEGGGGDG